jgi:hypothetical protein
MSNLENQIILICQKLLKTFNQYNLILVLPIFIFYCIKIDIMVSTEILISIIISIIIVIILLGIGFYKFYTPSSSQSSPTEHVLKKYYTKKNKKEGFENATNANDSQTSSGPTNPMIINDKYLSIMNDLAKSAPRNIFSDCPTQVTDLQGGDCYHRYVQFKRNELDADTLTSLILLSSAGYFEILNLNGMFTELKTKLNRDPVLTDFIEYNPNTKIVKVQFPRAINLPDDLVGTFALPDFIKKIQTPLQESGSGSAM